MEADQEKQSIRRLDQLKTLLKHILPEDPFFFESSRYPLNPGCYLMKDHNGVVIYVGKAKNLRDRLSSYFHSQHREPRIAQMVRRVRMIEVILVNNEWESLVLENNLIKHYQPYFNARLKSIDSGYSYIIQTTEEFPRLLPYMRNGYSKELDQIQGKSIEKRYGPYLNRRFRDILLEFVVDYFGIRTCTMLPQRACLRYDINRCTGACAGLVTAERYAARLEEAAVYLSYQKADMVDFTLGEMKRRMQAHANRLEFESAQRIRDQIHAMENIRVKQIVERDLAHDQDIVCFGEQAVLVMRLHKGAVVRLDGYKQEPSVGSEEAFLLQQYQQKSPQEIIVNTEHDLSYVERAIHAKSGNLVKIMRVETEEAADLMELCQLNLNYRLKNQLA
jgi:excinuclease ABC subunit C